MMTAQLDLAQPKCLGDTTSGHQRLEDRLAAMNGYVGRRRSKDVDDFVQGFLLCQQGWHGALDRLINWRKKRSDHRPAATDHLP